MSVQKRCLIVDDSDIIREITARIVVELGLEAAQAEDASTAIAYCLEQKPDIVLLDWDLPSMGALDFLHSAAQMAADEKPTVILCATENDPQQFTLAKGAGAAHHILKPFDKAVIASKLTEIGVLEGVDGIKIATAD